MNLTDAAACYRITKLIIDDELTQPIRARIFRRFNPDEGSKIGYALTCYWCCGVYVAAGIVAARRFAPNQWGPIAEMLSLSAATGWLATHED